MPLLKDFKAFVLFCAENGVLQAKLGDMEVVLDSPSDAFSELMDEEISDEEALFAAVE